MSKKVVILSLMIAMCFSMAACSKSTDSSSNALKEETKSEQKTTDVQTEQKDEKLFKEPVTISLMYPDASSAWPYNDNWYVKKVIEEKTNVKLNVIPVDSTKYNEKINLIMASGEMPDIIAHMHLIIPKQYGLQGAFINMGENMDKTPNFKKWADKNKEHTQKFLASDGNLYTFPGYGVGITNHRFWMYRKDIFDKHEIKPPTDENELFNALIELKKEYPDSYPFVYRKDNFDCITSAWGMTQYPYYDFEKKEWRHGAIEDSYKQFLTYMKKLYDNKLIPPDIFAMDDKACIDMITQGKSFITIDYIGRLGTFEATGKASNADYMLEYMTPLKGKFIFTPVDYQNITVSSTSKNIDNVLKFIDWYYTDEAIELLSWGRENETYKVIDGKRQFIDSNLRAAYGISVYGWYGALNKDALKSNYPSACIKAIDEQGKYEMKENPRGYVALNDEENEIKATIEGSIKKYQAEQIARFILGQRSLDEWDKFVSEIKAMDVDKLLKAYDGAYKRMLGEVK